MKEDMTYNEIDLVKSNISLFTEFLKKFAESEGRILIQADIDFFSLLSKHIIFYKYMYIDDCPLGHFYKVLISDCYYLILSIIRNEMRYIYVNERSIIENYARLIINKTVEENHVTEQILGGIKVQYNGILTDAEFSLIKSEYAMSCSYIHGGDVLGSVLSDAFNECIKNNQKFKDKNKYYVRVQRLLKSFDNILIVAYKYEVSGAFHRRKSLLEYLLGKDSVNLLFK